jgi:hypothetical protein
VKLSIIGKGSEISKNKRKQEKIREIESDSLKKHSVI